MYRVLLILFLFFMSFAKAQYSGLTTAVRVEMGYYPTKEYDTVKAVLLVSDCNDCPTKSMSAFAVRHKYSYIGDRMPPGKYEDEWRVINYFTKKGFSDEIIIWQAKLL